MLTDYLQSYLGGLAEQLDWDSTDYEFIVSETLELYGMDTEAQATDSKKLHALAKVITWKTVLREVTFNYDFSADGASFKRSQMYALAKQNLDEAMKDALEYLPAYEILSGEMTTEHDPYIYLDYSGRSL